MRRVEPFLAQERPEFAVAGAGVRSPEHLELVGRCKTPSGVPGGDLGIRRDGHSGAFDRRRPSGSPTIAWSTNIDGSCSSTS